MATSMVASAVTSDAPVDQRRHDRRQNPDDLEKRLLDRGEEGGQVVHHLRDQRGEDLRRLLS
ncbi:MAG: hypothetical protein ACLR3C_13515 [Eggerthella lenta]